MCKRALDLLSNKLNYFGCSETLGMVNSTFVKQNFLLAFCHGICIHMIVCFFSCKRDIKFQIPELAPDLLILIIIRQKCRYFGRKQRGSNLGSISY